MKSLNWIYVVVISLVLIATGCSQKVAETATKTKFSKVIKSELVLDEFLQPTEKWDSMQSWQIYNQADKLAWNIIDTCFAKAEPGASPKEIKAARILEKNMGARHLASLWYQKCTTSNGIDGRIDIAMTLASDSVKKELEKITAEKRDNLFWMNEFFPEDLMLRYIQNCWFITSDAKEEFIENRTSSYCFDEFLQHLAEKLPDLSVFNYNLEKFIPSPRRLSMIQKIFDTTKNHDGICILVEYHLYDSVEKCQFARKNLYKISVDNLAYLGVYNYINDNQIRLALKNKNLSQLINEFGTGGWDYYEFNDVLADVLIGKVQSYEDYKKVYNFLNDEHFSNRETYLALLEYRKARI